MNLYLEAPLFEGKIYCPHCVYYHTYEKDNDVGVCEDGYYIIVQPKYTKNEYFEYWKNLFFVIYQETEDGLHILHVSKTYPWVCGILKKYMPQIHTTKIDLLKNTDLYDLPLNKFKLFGDLITLPILKKYLRCGKVVIERIN